MKKVLIICFLFLNVASFSQITWTTDSIPMRDGKWLLADYYIPATCTNCPVILIQTPYQKNTFHSYLPLGVGTDLPNSDYAFVIVDWRGFYGSLAAAVPSPNRGEDGYDVIDWIAQQSWCDGNVGTWGPSALGKIQFETAREQHPNHKCAVPQVAHPVTRYEDYFPGGVYRTEYVQQLDALGYGMSTFLLANPVKNISWSVAQNQTTYPALINIPFFMIGGWFDHNVDGMLEFFDLLKTQSPVAVRDKHKLLMGPWCHGGSGAASVGSLNQGDWQFPSAAGMSDYYALLFFDYYLKGQTANGWTIFDNYNKLEYETGGGTTNFDFPWSPQMDTFFLNKNKILTQYNLVYPGDTTIVYDPKDPSPTVGGPTLKPSLDQGPYDQSSLVESRTDIATFTTELAPQVFFYGKPHVHLFVSTDKKDTDFTVRLTDYDYNTGKSIILADGITRLRFRDGFTANDTAIAVSGQIYELDIELPFISHTTGYTQLRLDVSSSNYPRFDLNLNNGGAMYTAGDTLVANNTIYFDAAHPSYIILPNMIMAGLDEIDSKKTIPTYPNPASDEINITLPSSENWNISISDITGKIIHTEKHSGNKYVGDVSTYANGIYFIRLENEAKQLFHSRFIKQ